MVPAMRRRGLQVSGKYISSLLTLQTQHFCALSGYFLPLIDEPSLGILLSQFSNITDIISNIRMEK